MNLTYYGAAKGWRKAASAAAALVALLSAGCVVGPAYRRPDAPAPPAYKEEPPPGWKEAQPADGVIRGKWWEIFNDPALNHLEEQVNLSNQNVLMAEAQFRQAAAAVGVARSALFPTASASVSATGSRESANLLGSPPAGVSAVGTYNLPFGASYTADVWGSIRRGVKASTEAAQVTSAQVENARLLYQAELASDYFQLHGLDGDDELLERTVESYTEYLQLTRNRFAGGVATDSDVAQAETQLYTTQAELVDVGVARKQLEHAVAILIGKPPAALSIPRAPLKGRLPVIPVGVPSELLERRPDIAAAERQVAAANEQIGIANAAFYPALTLSVSAGIESASFLEWLSWPSRVWSLGPQVAETLFDAGRRRGQVREAQAAYDAAAASYRQTVLTAFQQVEDNLSALRVMGDEAGTVANAVRSAERSVVVSTAQYKGGIANYLQVIEAQTVALADERTAVDLLTRRMVASVQLIEALGGGWDASKVPAAGDFAGH